MRPQCGQADWIVGAVAVDEDTARSSRRVRRAICKPITLPITRAIAIAPRPIQLLLSAAGTTTGGRGRGAPGGAITIFSGVGVG
jgi:hypothetical protein